MYHTKSHDIIGRENSGDVRVCVQQLPCQFGATFKIEFSVEHNGLNRILRGLEGAHEAACAVAEIAVLARPGKMGDLPMAETEEILCCQSASRFVVGADRGKCMVRSGTIEQYDGHARSG